MKQNYLIAVVEFLGTDYEPTGSQYYFRLYDRNITAGDYVLCETSNGLRIGVVDMVTAEQEYYYLDDYAVNRQVISKVDPTQYINRKLAIRNKIRRNMYD